VDTAFFITTLTERNDSRNGKNLMSGIKTADFLQVSKEKIYKRWQKVLHVFRDFGDNVPK